jgi:two-component system cell cycle response regulator CpdR
MIVVSGGKPERSMEKKRILIVDDDKAVRVLLAAVLNTANYEIDVAVNGVDAINHIDGIPYDLIITDYLMPEMDGLELTRRVKSIYPTIPILIITGTESARDLLKSEATACFSKPFNIFDLLSFVKNILNVKSARA